jgi:hypothetical protein
MPIGLGTAVVGAGIIGAGASIYSANKAASAQTNAANQATNAQMSMFNTTRQALQPYIDFGTGPTVSNLLSKGGSTMDFANNLLMNAKGLIPGAGGDSQSMINALKQTPGYQFTLDQGLNATTNMLSAQGLSGASGPLGKGLANYAGGLAETTYQQQLTNLLNSYGLISGQGQNITGLGLQGTTIGANAAAGLATNATQTGSNIGSNMIGAGNAQAGAAMNIGNTVGGLPTNMLNQYAQLNLLNRLGVPGTGGFNLLGGNFTNWGGDLTSTGSASNVGGVPWPSGVGGAGGSYP